MNIFLIYISYIQGINIFMKFFGESKNNTKVGIQKCRLNPYLLSYKQLFALHKVRFLYLFYTI